MMKFKIQAEKYFHLAKNKFPNFPFNTFEEFWEQVGEAPKIYGEKLIIVLKNYDKPHVKSNYFWGTRSDEMRARHARKKTYIWRE